MCTCGSSCGLTWSNFLSAPQVCAFLFKNAGTLATKLTEARDAYQLGKIERQMEKTDLLILDKLSYMSFSKYESELLFKAISERSKRSSTIVTTNLPFSKWTELFENATMVSALVDRLTYADI